MRFLALENWTGNLALTENQQTVALDGWCMPVSCCSGNKLQEQKFHPILWPILELFEFDFNLDFDKEYWTTIKSNSISTIVITKV